MTDRRQIITEVLVEQYPEIDVGAHMNVAEFIDEHWHILKKASLEGKNGDWTMAGHIQAVIWDTYGGGAQSATVAHKVLRRLAEEKMNNGTPG